MLEKEALKFDIVSIFLSVFLDQPVWTRSEKTSFNGYKIQL